MTDQIKDSIANMTTAELKALIIETVQEALKQMVDPDALLDPPLSEEVKERLRQYQKEKPRGIPVEQVIKELGLDFDDEA